MTWWGEEFQFTNDKVEFIWSPSSHCSATYTAHGFQLAVSQAFSETKIGIYKWYVTGGEGVHT